MIINTFNGWSVLQLPASPGFSELQITRRNLIGINTSPFNLQSRLQQWPGADIITGHATLPPMVRSEAAVWDAWLAECCGPLNTFMVPMPFNGQRLPNAAPNLGTPVVNGSGANTPGTNQLSTRGWTPSVARLLLAGDYLQVGYRCHILVDQGASDSNGDSVLTVWPSIRETPGDGTPVIVHNPKALCRLTKMDNAFTVDTFGMWHLEFNFAEAK